MDKKPGEESTDLDDLGSRSLLEPVVRRSFRIPVKQREDIRVTIKGLIHPVKDVSSRGVSFPIQDCGAFPAGRFLEGCILFLPGEVLKDLNATVMHCSPDPEDGWLVGIQWLNLSPETEERIGGHILALRREFFEKEIM
jgi:hypothetical protein